MWCAWMNCMRPRHPDFDPFCSEEHRIEAWEALMWLLTNRPWEDRV